MRTSTDEVSLCGCYIETMFTMEVGTKISLVLPVKGESIRANGIVVTKYPQVGNGIDFVELSTTIALSSANSSWNTSTTTTQQALAIKK